ncbi:hypothetical protein [Bradyrhizobium guangdongense]|uniref:Uncharacterized protein n=1 Tax=Bradyrhizobium guangdongense TaxID=1325090 RepID=A0ABX6UE53_9BRAD|nr:hypothetical protein [Bradyrhizobium guangdongense]QAU38515.1 hypothetical protein X265_13150 [Bradyrhizobium guangdongense]QOZ59575.1 hypothetical protein XH86_13155 [Bradyrhizobium guangdongense]
MSNSFTSALLAALNASVEIMLDDEPVAKDRKEPIVSDPPVNNPTASLPARGDRENRYAVTVGFGMAKIRSSGQGA